MTTNPLKFHLVFAAVALLFGAAGGTFVGRVEFRTARQPIALTADDVDGDGAPDLLVCGYSRNSLSCLINRGARDFHGKIDTQTPNGPLDVAVGDLDGDGLADAVVANTFASVLSVHAGLGDGHFGRAGAVRVGSAPFGIVARDLDGDGDADLAVANSAFQTGRRLIQTLGVAVVVALLGDRSTESVASFRSVWLLIGGGYLFSALAILAYPERQRDC